MKYALGQILFDSATHFPGSVASNIQYVWDTQEHKQKPVGKGVGQQTLTLQGVVFVHCNRGSALSIVQSLQLMGEQMSAVSLMALESTGAGVHLGDFCITGVQANQEKFVNGKPLKTSYTLNLLRNAPIASSGQSNAYQSSSVPTFTTANPTAKKTPEPETPEPETPEPETPSTTGNDWLYGNSGRSSNVSSEQSAFWLGRYA